MPRGVLITCGLTALFLLAIVGTASTKMFATPLYSRIRPGMTREQVSELLYGDCRIRGAFTASTTSWSCTEGDIIVDLEGDSVVGKAIVRRGICLSA